ncbi:alpha-hydroxy acid oxidase [Acidovorax lacteus]|uniref:Alpha-hydroxy acid oxidase n=2 Tax=Acidovorax lacteus TaxID=1924988 RepID=A0ABP8LBS2_9BURK
MQHLSDAISLTDYETTARTRLPAGPWAYFQGGAGDEVTMRRNAEAWQTHTLRPRVMRVLAGGHSRSTLLGRPLACPVLAAPVAYQRMAHAEGEIGTALATSVLGMGMVLSTQSSTPLEEVASAAGDRATRGPLWFQLYLQPDLGLTRSLVQRAEAAGYDAIVLTVDAPCQGVRDRERRAGFRLPPGIRAVHLPPASSQPTPAGGSAASLFDGLLAQAPTWDDLAWLCTETTLPVLVKGVLHPDDARLAIQHGAAGVIVSNHGGRTLDTALPTARALPDICAALEGAVPVLVDGGIRRGTDVLKALALGAHAVLIGRPLVHGLACGGTHGVAHVLRLLHDEFEAAMALCGCRTLSDIQPGLLA